MKIEFSNLIQASCFFLCDASRKRPQIELILKCLHGTASPNGTMAISISRWGFRKSAESYNVTYLLWIQGDGTMTWILLFIWRIISALNRFKIPIDPSIPSSHTHRISFHCQHPGTRVWLLQLMNLHWNIIITKRSYVTLGWIFRFSFYFFFQR